MAGYRYGGTEFDAHLPLSEPKPRKKYERGTAQCGTHGGYDAHRRAKEPSCEPCLAAVRAYRKDWRDRVRAKQGKTLRPPAKCGTNAGYSAHQRKKEPFCQPCRDANTAYSRDYSARKRAA